MDYKGYSKIGINRMYKSYSGRLCNEIESEEDVLERLECIPCKSRELLEYVWTLNPKYKGKTLTQVEKKLGITRKEAESNFHFGKYVLYFKDFKEIETEELRKVFFTTKEECQAFCNYINGTEVLGYDYNVEGQPVVQREETE